MKEFLLAISILRALREIRDGGDAMDPIGIVDGLAPGLVEFFGKGDITPADLDIIKLAFTDLLSLFRR
jgi:hypothetical protein